MTIHIINGPNLNLLGKRQPEIYGHQGFDSYLQSLRQQYPDHDLTYFQSNHEGDLIDKMQEIGFTDCGIIVNPGGYTHTSIALGDTVAAITAPVVEVHISDIYQRESFRHTSYIKDHCIKSIVGRGLDGYAEAVSTLLGILEV